MSSSARLSPRDYVFTTLAWNGGSKIADIKKHMDRLHEHAQRLRINLPETTEVEIRRILRTLKLDDVDELIPKKMIRISYTPNNTEPIKIESRDMSLRNFIGEAITKQAPYWSKSATGCKHGDWAPYIEAIDSARISGADFTLLVRDFKIIDAGQATPVVLDVDGVAYFPKPSDGAVRSITLDSIIEQIREQGIPIKEGNLNERMVARAREMIIIGTGVGVCKIESIDGVEFLEPSDKLFEIAKNALKQHYANPNTWTDMEAES